LIRPDPDPQHRYQENFDQRYLYAKEKQDKAARIRKAAYMTARKEHRKHYQPILTFSKTTQNKKHDS
jgi:hypothetical protein